MTEEETVSETSNAQKLTEIIQISRDLNKESERHHTLEERLNTKYTQLRQRLEKVKKENERIETTLDYL